MGDGNEDTHVPDRDPLVGRVVGAKFLLEDVLGAGAMGVVYLARHTGLDKRVAVKVLRAETKADPSRARRFKAEARAASRLDHPNSVQILDFGDDPQDGLLYLAMELLDGEDLQATLRREGRLSIGRAGDIMLQTLAALATAHDAGIVHRDLKPGNIMLTVRRDDDGQPVDFVKVCDFGLAKILDPVEDASGAPLTKAGSVFGTPAYMSPEQARGEVVDARSDLYACGAMLYRMITGEPLFASDTAWGLLMKHINEAYVPAEARLPGLSPGISQVIDRALAKERDQRFGSAREMRSALKEALRGLGETGRSFSETGMGPLPRAQTGMTQLGVGSSGGESARPPSAEMGRAGSLAGGTVDRGVRAESRVAPLAAPDLTAPPPSDLEASRAPLAGGRRTPWMGAVIGAAVVASAGLAYQLTREGPVVTRPIPHESAAVVGAAAAPPVSSPVAPPVSLPAASPVSSPVVSPVSSPVAPPVSSPLPSPVSSAASAEPRASSAERGARAPRNPAPTVSAQPPEQARVPSPSAPSASTAPPPSVPPPSPAPVIEPTPRATAAALPPPAVPALAPAGPFAVEIGKVRATGGMSQRRVADALERLRGPLAKCLDSTRDRLGPKGELSLRGMVDADGRLQQLEGLEGADEGLACAKQVLGGAQLQKPDTGEASLALTFRYRSEP